MQRAQGHLDDALATYQRELDLATTARQPILPAAGAAYVGMAEVAYQRGELDTATQHLTEGLALCRQIVLPDALANGSATLAWIRHARGDESGALDAMAEAGRVADPSMTDLLNPVPAQRHGCCWPKATSAQPHSGQPNER
jgi:LuxR family transcriptional regulator, maltose regulon positive regulatory protein